MAISNRAKAGWVGLCMTCVAGFEGLRTVPYLDPVGIPTYCFGKIEHVDMSARYTPAQCEQLLAEDLPHYNDGINKCIHVEMPDTRRAAIVSFAYNVGVPATCGSTLVRLLNEGDPAAACDELLRWNTATKAGVRITLPGLTARRFEEWQLCRKDL